MVRKRFPVSWLIGLTAAVALVVSAKPMVKATQNVYQEIRRFIEVVNLVRDSYVAETDTRSLIDGAIVGLLKQLDSHSLFIPAELVERINEGVAGEKYGIGVDLAMDQGIPVVVSPLPDSPAERIHLRPGDRILAIDGQPVSNKRLYEVQNLLRGEIGTAVQLTIERRGYPEPLILHIIRDRVPVRSVQAAFVWQDDIGYIKIGRFGRHVTQEVLQALNKLESHGIRRLILDIRNNGGGLVEGAVAVADLFLPGGRKIVEIRGRMPSLNQTYYSSSRYSLRTYPLILLVNRGTASAAEIFAAAFQDWDRAILVGETTFGKGSVQQQIPLSDGSAIRLTVAHYYSPLGRTFFRDEDAVGAAILGKPWTANKKSVITLTGRRLQSAGGVLPDIAQKSVIASKTTTKIETKLLILEFVQRIRADVQKRFSSFASFREGFQVSFLVLEKFLRFLEEKKEKFYYQDIMHDRGYLNRAIKVELARQIWGTDAATQVLLDGDPQALKALSCFPEAERLCMISLNVK